jgi:site-specific recombinase XerD
MAYLIDGASTPNAVNSSVARTREYLTGKEVEKLMEAARKSSRHGHRDATMILIAYRHGLRASEVCDLRALRRLQREQPPGPYVFASERGGPIAPKSFHTLISRLGERARMAFPIHPHMLRHGCGYALANAGHDTRAIQAWMGHKNIQHTVRYTELAPHRFKDFWRD